MTIEILPFPSARSVIIDAGYMASKRHVIHGFLELDITKARRILKKSTGNDGQHLSFTAFIVASLGRAIHIHPQVQAYRDFRAGCSSSTR